jgi:hypothetical protein
MMGQDYGTLAHTYVMEFQDHDICLHMFMEVVEQKRAQIELKFFT